MVKILLLLCLLLLCPAVLVPAERNSVGVGSDDVVRQGVMGVMMVGGDETLQQGMDDLSIVQQVVGKAAERSVVGGTLRGQQKQVADDIDKAMEQSVHTSMGGDSEGQQQEVDERRGSEVMEQQGVYATQRQGMHDGRVNIKSEVVQVLNDEEVVLEQQQHLARVVSDIVEGHLADCHLVLFTPSRHSPLVSAIIR